jgi:hypothetical protein
VWGILFYKKAGVKKTHMYFVAGGLLHGKIASMEKLMQ